MVLWLIKRNFKDIGREAFFIVHTLVKSHLDLEPNIITLFGHRTKKSYTDSSLAPSLSVTHCSPSDHFPIFTKLSVDCTPLPPPTFHSFGRLRSIDINSLLSDLQCSRLITNHPNSLGSLLIAYNTTMSFLLDKHAPVIIKFSSRKSKSNPWFTSTLRVYCSSS